MRAMVLAAGHAARLRPLTDFLPKPMMPIANRPVLHHLLNLLARHDVRQVGINLHATPEVAQGYFVGKPCSGDELSPLLRERQPDPQIGGRKT